MYVLLSDWNFCRKQNTKGTSVKSFYLIVKLDGAGDSLSEGEAGGLCLDAAQLLPQVGGHVLGNQAVGGLDSWEFGLKNNCQKNEFTKEQLRPKNYVKLKSIATES